MINANLGKDQFSAYLTLMLPIILMFFLGIANFAMHKAVMESGHPAIQSTRVAFDRATGGWGGYALEYTILLAAMSFVNVGYMAALGAYLGYTCLNGVAAWILLKGRM
ncbi:hypothetical protein [Alterisphingorhabdus coralli]|uniref:Uncharacterized protein n=1 Tax=Alterisphingorhabdus coralli TaxID=3071408 RepID=A0AA97I203_9SPHN|nr:hypothetical protein [Parasphingorhabdus sp. SCSIO 66989]WOE75275.1 hypothetical protein RB602_00720 [Parasphingorhabdus sp. SCSIO 66989]